MARLRLLGTPTLEHEGRTYPLAPERRSQLLAFLALRRTWVGRAELATMLWPDQGDKLAYTNLRKTLFRLRALPWAPEVEVEGASLRFAAPTDVADFEAALREGRLGEAAGLHAGELLAGFDDTQSEAWSSWLAFERERLKAAWRGAALAHLAGAADPGEGVALSARLLESDPLDEAALRAHMAALAASGQAAQARQAYRDFVARLASDLGLAPGSELQAFHDALGARPAAVPLPAAAPDDGFIGRSVELRQIATLLAQDDCRLVSLIGPGGVGKTRLARRALAEVGPRFAECAFVALEDAAVAADIASGMARELGVALAGRRDPLGEVVAFLAPRQALLVLDNFEQLAAQAPILERILRECPGVKMIVTTRVRLGLPLEQLLPLDGLPFPDPEDQDRSHAFDAVRLFVKGAKRVEPAFMPDVEAAAIAEICRQVEGLPLAIELAAAWVRVMSCDAIAAQLQEGLQLLRAADATRPARHASMQVVFDETWRLLGAAERDALARLSIFQGGFSPEAARAVAGASLPVLASLVDKSLLRKDRGRLHLHALLQHLAAARLAESDAREETHRAHASHYLRLLAQLRRGLDDGDREALQAVDIELQNCRAAWRWALAHPMRDPVRAAVLPLMSYCDHRFRLEEGLALLREAIASPLAHTERRLETLLLAAAAHLEYRLDRYAEAQATAARALEATTPANDHEARVQCFKVLGACALRLGQLEEARRNFAEALKQAPASIDPHNAAAMLDNMALVEKSMGHYDAAVRLSQQSLVQHRLLKDPAGEALCLNNLADLYLDRDTGSARAHLLEGLALCERHGIVGTRALILGNLGELCYNAGELDAAQRYMRDALDIAAATGNRALSSYLKVYTARIALARGEIDTARRDLAAAMELAIAIGRPSLKFAGISCFAALLRAVGEEACARSVLEFCASHPSVSARDRDRIRMRLEEFPAGGGERPWPGVSLDDLVNRIVLESPVGHAPLVAALRGA